MKRIFLIMGLLLFYLSLSACGAQGEPTSPPTVVPQDTQVVSAPPTLVTTVGPAATTTTIAVARTQWPPNLKNFMPANSRIVDSSEVDTDGDGVSEMLVIYQVNSLGRGLVIRREGDNGRAYALGGDKPAELFQESWTANTVRDLNGDGKIEILVEGVLKGTATMLNIFQWNGKAYVSLLSLAGSEGVAIDDPQNTGIPDFTALQLLFQRSLVMRAMHAEWKQTVYDIRSDVLFLLGPPSQFNYPEEAALAYYIFWDKDEPAEMFALLTEPQKSRTPLKSLEDLSRNVDEVRVESLTIDEEKADGATVTLSVAYAEHTTQKEQKAQHVWRLKKENKQWRLAEQLP